MVVMMVSYVMIYRNGGTVMLIESLYVTHPNNIEQDREYYDWKVNIHANFGDILRKGYSNDKNYVKSFWENRTANK